MCHSTYVDVKGRCVGVRSLLPPCGSWGLNSIMRLGCKHPHLLQHLTGPGTDFSYNGVSSMVTTKSKLIKNTKNNQGSGGVHL